MIDENPMSWLPQESFMGRRIREHDWAATSLGPIEEWSSELKLAASMVIENSFPSALIWGPDFITLYNDGFAPILGAKSDALGQSFAAIWSEAWPEIGPIVDRAFAGQSTFIEDFPLAIRRSEASERAYFTFSYSPVRAANGKVLGMIDTVVETTRTIRVRDALRESEARQAFLLKLLDVLRPLADPVEVQGEACKLLAEHMDVDRAYFVEVDEAADVARVERDFVRGTAASLAGEHRVADFGWAVAILRRGECHVVADTRVSPLVPEEDRAQSVALQIIACMGAPLIKDGQLVGALCVTSSRPREWSEAEVDLLRQVGERIWSDVLRARAETALRESEERLRMALEAGRMGTWRFDLATGRQQWSEQQFRLLGLQPDTQPPTRDFFLSLVHPGDLPLIEYSPEDLEPGRGLLDAEFRIVRPDGEVRWLVSHTTVRRNAEGEPIEMIGLNWDVTDRKQADMALRETEERLRQFGEASSDVLWIRNADNLQWEYLTSAFETIYGEDRDAALKGNNLRNWVDMILPEDREHALDNIRRVRQGQRVTFEYRITRPSDGQVRWLRNTDFPLWDAAGNVQRIGGIGHDSTLEKEAIDRQQVLMAELQHRTRNLIAVVQSLADKTVKESTSLGDFRERYRDRLKAVARVQGLLSRLDDGHRITFDRLLETELSALGVLDATDRVTLIGPRGIALRSGTVQTFALALHELATNAVKYGALAAPAGRLKVRWGVVPGEPGRLLTVEWRESGVVMPKTDTPPQGSGYGRELIERALPYQLKATTSYQLGSDGVCCTIAVPVSEAVEPEETSDV